jgi:DNA-directed RNA polymerase specialized sigma24 family protein
VTEDEAKEAYKIARWFLNRRLEVQPYSGAIRILGGIDDLIQEVLLWALKFPPKVEMKLTTLICKNSLHAACRVLQNASRQKRDGVAFTGCDFETFDPPASPPSLLDVWPEHATEVESRRLRVLEMRVMGYEFWEIAADFNCSTQRVHQLYKDGLRILREANAPKAHA